MQALTPDQIVAAKELQNLCRRLSADVVLIGAMAYRVWIHDLHRHTLDIDFAIAVDLDDYERLVALLREAGWEQEARREHRWTTPSGVRIDLLPAGPQLRRERILRWPASGMEMSLVGFNLVFKHAVSFQVAPDCALKVIPLPVLLLLKIVAFTENPHVRQKDLQDFAAILARFDPQHDERFRHDVLETGIEYQAVGAYLLGTQFGPLCSPEESRLVRELLEKLSDDDSPQFWTFRRSIEHEFAEPETSLANKLVEAFRKGFESSAWS
jgi:predicted nucleotidyltransferase